MNEIIQSWRAQQLRQMRNERLAQAIVLALAILVGIGQAISWWLS